ncbi:MAG: P-II family nitrogen regulator [Rikenellaceae bacterium]|nr:P-II family nitrogen regulator [Rikenellaceae bacterium]
MKKIEAIIRKTKFDEVKEALLAADIEWFSYTTVRGIGKARQDRIYRGVIYGTDIIERLMLTIVVREQNADKTIRAIIASARTGEVGDGRIFVSDVDQTYSIRTGESGDRTLYIADEKK